MAKRQGLPAGARSSLWRLWPAALIVAGAVLLIPTVGSALLALLLRTLGLGVVFWPPGLIATALVAWRWRPLLRRHWRRWLGATLLGLALSAFLSFFVTHEGILSEVSLGGNLGKVLARNLPLVGVAIGNAIASIRVELPPWRIAVATVILALAGFLLVAPRATVAVLGHLLRWAWDGSNAFSEFVIRGLHRLQVGGARRLPHPPQTSPPQTGDTALAEAAPVPEAAGHPLGAAKAAPGSGVPRPATAPTLAVSGRKPAAPGEWWKLPPMSLLEAGVETPPNGAELQRRSKLVEEALASYGIEARVVEVSVGPTVTRFGVEPGWVRRHKESPERDALGRPRRDEFGRPLTKVREVSRTRVKVEAIANLSKDLALALAAPTLRIEAPVPGKGYVGLELPNSTFTAVTLRGVLESPAFTKLAAKTKLALALGKGVGGEPLACDLATLPHLLIAGATGSGKSVCLKAFLTSLAMKTIPDDVRIILVDPKRVELATFGRLPHLLVPPVVEPDKVVQMLKDLVAEMDGRYRKFAALKVNNLESYNHAAPDRRMPRVVLFVDELADLMMVSPVDVEQGLCRLAQLGRAAGIHLVVATQRPSVDVVTGLIKANFPARISFAMASQVDSRVILDTVGAEKLLGRGDMLFLPTDSPQPRRAQGVFVSEAEIERVMDHWARQAPPAPKRIEAWPVPPPPPARQPAAPPAGAEDPLLQAARELAAQLERVSPSLFQRRLRIGHAKAQELLEALEAEGTVGPPEAGESRLVRAKGKPSTVPQEPDKSAENTPP